MQVISFMNMKGGVGKTTLAVNVAYALAYFHRKKVLIVDGDPQFNASQYLMGTDGYLRHINNAKKGTLKEIFVPRKAGPLNTVTGASKRVDKSNMSLASCACSIFAGGEGRGKLDLIPSTLSLIEVETSKRGTERRLKSYLKEKATGYDYVIIDCPPTISIFSQAAILASDKYVVPIKPDPLSVVGLPLLERWLEEYTEDEGVKIESVGLVFTMVRGPLPSAMRDAMNDVRNTRKGEVFHQFLSQATDVAKSVAAHEPVFIYKKGAKASSQIQEITNEFVARTKGV